MTMPKDHDDPEREAIRSEPRGGKVRKIEPPPPPWLSRVCEVDDTWFTTTPAPRQMLLTDDRADAAGYLPLGEATQLVASGGAGKTMLLAQASVSIATGLRFLGTFTVAEPGPVLICLGEEKEAEVRRRIFQAGRALEMLAADHGARWMPPDRQIVTLPLSGLNCALLERDSMGNPRETQFCKWLRAFIGKRGGFRWIAIDPLSRFGGPDAEKDNAVGTVLVEIVESLGLITGATTTAAHHTNAMSRGPDVTEDDVRGRGVSALHDGFRWQAKLVERSFKFKDPKMRQRFGRILSLSHSKSNYTVKAEPLLLRRHEGGSLIALDDADLLALEEAKRDSAEKSKRAKERDEQKTRDRLAKEAEASRRREERESDASKDRQEKTEAATLYATKLLADGTKRTVQTLRALIKSECRCRTEVAEVAIDRARKALASRPETVSQAESSVSP